MIAYILNTYPSLTETFISSQIRELRKRNINIVVFAIESKGCENVFIRPKLYRISNISNIVYIIRRYNGTLGRLSKLFLRLITASPREAKSLIVNTHTIAYFIRKMDALAVDYIHAGFLSWPSLMALAINIITGKNFSISAHSKDIYCQSGLLNEKVKRAEFVSVCNKAGYEHLRKKLPAKYHKKLSLNHHGLDFSRSNPKIILAVGRLVEKKGFEYLIKAFSIIAEQDTDCRLVIIGNGPLRKKLGWLADKLNLGSSVFFVGALPHFLTLQMIENASMLVCPSVIAEDGDMDGIANVILEAFAKKTAVIVSDIAGFTDITEDKQSCLAFQSKNVKELALKINILLTNSALRERLAKNATNLLKRKFRLESNAENLYEKFRQAAAENKNFAHRRRLHRRSENLSVQCVGRTCEKRV